MRRCIVLFLAAVAALSSCDTEELWKQLIDNDPSKGTEPIESFSFGYMSEKDQKAAEDALAEWSKNKGKGMIDMGQFPAVSFMSKEEIASVPDEQKQYFSGSNAAMVNTMEIPGSKVLCKVTCNPFAAKMTELTVSSSDESVVSFEKTDDIRAIYMLVHSVGECDVKVVAEGVNRMERNYHIRLVDKVSLMVYTDAFWLNNLTARLKYKTKALPVGVKSLYMNVRDSATVIGYSRIVDQRNGDTAFRGVTDTIAYPVNQHTDKFRVGRRIILRNVSDAVSTFNNTYNKYSYIRLDEKTAQSFKDNLSQKVKFSVRKSGDAYEMDILGQTISMDKYQIYWINRSVSNNGQWPSADREVVEVDGKYYLKFIESRMCKRIECALDIIGSNPYLMFDILMKKSQVSSETDADEVDPYDDFRDGSGEVVDSLGSQLKDYFVVTFINNMSQHKKDSLANALNDIVHEIPDSLQWQLTY